MPILPAETTDSHLSERFYDGCLCRLPTGLPSRGFALLSSEIDKSLVDDSVDESVTEQAQGYARRADCLGIGHALLDLRARSESVSEP